METNLYLIRHGETDWNRLQRIQGHTDIPLNENGLRQAERVAVRLAAVPVHKVYSSDLLRARQTAEEIVKHHQADLEPCPRLRERNYGQWEGLRMEEILQKFPEHRLGRDAGGKYGIETLDEMQQRGMKRLLEFCTSHLHSHLVVVSHGGFINALLHHISEGKYGTGKTKLGNTAFNHISYKDGRWQIHTVNDTSHLLD